MDSAVSESSNAGDKDQGRATAKEEWAQGSIGQCETRCGSSAAAPERGDGGVAKEAGR